MEKDIKFQNSNAFDIKCLPICLIEQNDVVFGYIVCWKTCNETGAIINQTSNITSISCEAAAVDIVLGNKGLTYVNPYSYPNKSITIQVIANDIVLKHEFDKYVIASYKFSGSNEIDKVSYETFDTIGEAYSKLKNININTNESNLFSFFDIKLALLNFGPNEVRFNSEIEKSVLACMCDSKCAQKCLYDVRAYNYKEVDFNNSYSLENRMRYIKNTGIEHLNSSNYNYIYIYAKDLVNELPNDGNYIYEFAMFVPNDMDILSLDSNPELYSKINSILSLNVSDNRQIEFHTYIESYNKL